MIYASYSLAPDAPLYLDDEDMFQGRRIVTVGQGHDSYPFMPHLTIEVAMQKRTPGRIRRSARSG